MRLIRSFILASACLALMAGPIQAQTPTAGAARMYEPRTALTFRFGGAPPASIQSAVQSAATDFSSPTWNNSRTPSFAFSASAGGSVTYSSSTRSPCSGNPLWLQCASDWGSANFRIFIRNLASAPLSNYTWCDIAIEGICFDTERAVLHEMLHVVLGVPYHDTQGHANTIMGAAAPAYPAAFWNTHHIQRCDEAAAQLLYGVINPYGQYADCFKSIPRAGKTGLVPSGQLDPVVTTLCLFSPAVLSGRHALSGVSSYKALAGTPLAGRTIWFDRKPATSSVWTLNVASTTASASPGRNWTRSFSTSSGTTVSYDFRPHSDAEPGVDAGRYSVVTITWRMC